MKIPALSFVKLYSSFLILLWAYAAFSKLFAFRHFDWAMHNQAIPAALASALIYLLPPAEIIIALMLVSEKHRKAGLFLSLVLLLAFTAYILLVLIGTFGRVPCSCGGILEQMGWTTHLIFNFLCLTLNLITILTLKRKENAALTKI